MRLVSWAGAAAMSVSAAAGFYAGSAMHRHDPVTIQVCDAAGELSDAPPSRLSPPVLVEDIDLTCPPTMTFGSQSPEPPLADPFAGVILPTSFTLPAGPPVDSELLPMPYLTDDPSPPLLPPLGDVPPLSSGVSDEPEPNNPIFQAVKQFVAKAAEDYPSDPHEHMNRLINESEQEKLGADTRRFWMSDQLSTPPITDKVPLGKPPVCEHPSTTPPAAAGKSSKSNKPVEDRVPQRLAPLPSGDGPPLSKVDTTEIRPDDLPPKNIGGPF